MLPASPIVDYLDAVARELAFDPALSRRVRHEIEDHLAEAVMTERPTSSIDAEARAIARFGTPREIAAPYRTTSLYARQRKTGALLLCAIAAIFIAMESRVVWYGLMQWGSSAKLRAVGEAVIPIDRYALLLAIALGILGWLFSASRPIPAIYRPACRAELRCCQLLAAAAALAILVAVICETLLTGWRLAEARWSMVSLFPAVSLVVEVATAFAALAYTRNTGRRFRAGAPRPVRPSGGAH